MRLENLHLSSNRISVIENLEPLVNLQLLWLNENRIQVSPMRTQS